MLQKDAALLPQIDQVENRIDELRRQLIDRHIERLNAGNCKAESSGVFINLVSNLERLGDHLTYIAYTVQGESVYNGKRSRGLQSGTLDLF